MGVANHLPTRSLARVHGRARRAAPGLITLLAQESPGIRENPLPGILLRTVLGQPTPARRSADATPFLSLRTTTHRAYQ